MILPLNGKCHLRVSYSAVFSWQNIWRPTPDMDQLTEHEFLLSLDWKWSLFFARLLVL